MKIAAFGDSFRECANLQVMISNAYDDMVFQCHGTLVQSAMLKSSVKIFKISLEQSDLMFKIVNQLERKNSRLFTIYFINRKVTLPTWLFFSELLLFFLNGPIPASFCLFSLFSRYNFNNTN